MALRTILTREDSTLRKRSREVTSFDKRLHILLDDMIETLHAANGAGLAAPQVGVLRRAVVVEVEENTPIELVNPQIIAEEGEQEGCEGCLSVPGVYGLVRRPMKVTVRAQDRHGKPFEMIGEGLMARAFCHEVEHLDGHLFTERVIRYLDDEELLNGNSEE